MTRRDTTHVTPPQSAVERIASELRERALAAADGESLGSEEELSIEFGVSKPTLRQAARLLQYEEVLHVKRGVRGGYFAQRPKLDMIASLAAIHLRASAVSAGAIDEVLEALAPLTISCVIRSGKTDQFAEFAVDSARNLSELTAEDMIKTEGRFAKLLFSLTGNFALQLIYSIFYQFGSTIPRRRGPQPGRSDAVRMRIALAKALYERKNDEALARFIEYRRMINRGIRGDMDVQKAPKTKSRKSSG